MSTSAPAPLSSAEAPPPSRSHLARKGLPILLATLLSRPLGFVREAVQAALFGASRLTDAFVVAYNVPEMIQTLLFSGVLSNFFVPVITRYREQKDELSTVFSLAINGALVFALLVAGLCFVGAPALITLAAPGLSGADHDLAVFLFRFMLPMLVLHCLLAVLKGVLNSLDHYAMPEYAGVFFNLLVIASALTLSSSYGITSLAIGVVLGSVVQVLVQLPVLVRSGVRYRFTLALAHPALREMGGLVMGAVIATAVVPINAFVARALASTLPAGSISALAYAFRVFLLPVSLFAVPVYTVLLTDLSAAHQQSKSSVFKAQATAGLSLLFAVALPATAVLLALAVPVTRLLYERGQFSTTDVVLTSQALAAYVVGTLGYGTSQVMVRLFNATKDTRTPAWVGVASIAFHTGGCLLLMQVWGHWGIALTTSLVSYVNTAVLYLIFRRRHGPLDERVLARRFVIHLLLATGLAACLSVLGHPLAEAPGSLMTLPHLSYFAAIMVVGAGLYVACGVIFKVDEIQALRRTIVRWLTGSRGCKPGPQAG
ncbi:MAG: murein biosynthesis integral membrane protein MurJ [Candidatus Binatia bacterium]|nr:murein biosynthesis integral membrane protein MurJ [Candidatus Binatia bacterium]